MHQSKIVRAFSASIGYSYSVTVIHAVTSTPYYSLQLLNNPCSDSQRTSCCCRQNVGLFVTKISGTGSRRCVCRSSYGATRWRLHMFVEKRALKVKLSTVVYPCLLLCRFIPATLVREGAIAQARRAVSKRKAVRRCHQQLGTRMAWPLPSQSRRRRITLRRGL